MAFNESTAICTQSALKHVQGCREMPAGLEPHSARSELADDCVQEEAAAFSQCSLTAEGGGRRDGGLG